MALTKYTGARAPYAGLREAYEALMRKKDASLSGGAYARDSMLIYMDPEVLSGIGAMVPDLIKEMPAIMQKVGAATAHLPVPAPDKKKGKGRRRS